MLLSLPLLQKGADAAAAVTEATAKRQSKGSDNGRSGGSVESNDELHRLADRLADWLDLLRVFQLVELVVVRSSLLLKPHHWIEVYSRVNSSSARRKWGALEELGLIVSTGSVVLGSGAVSEQRRLPLRDDEHYAEHSPITRTLIRPTNVVPVSVLNWLWRTLLRCIVVSHILSVRKSLLFTKQSKALRPAAAGSNSRTVGFFRLFHTANELNRWLVSLTDISIPSDFCRTNV